MKKSLKIFFIFCVYFLAIEGMSFAEDVRDVKAPVNLPPNFFIIYLLVVILFILTVVLLIRFLLDKRRKLSQKIQSPKLCDQLAYERLESLKRKNLPALGKIKEYYCELSDIARRYIEDRFQIRAPEMTTQEFLWSFKNSRDLRSEYQDRLKDFLTSCDMVKFAKYGPTQKEIDESFDFAKKFVDETKPVVEMPKEGKS